MPGLPPSAHDSSRTRECIIGGFFISFSKSSSWIKQKHGIDLAEDPSKGYAVVQHLTRLSLDHGYCGDIDPRGSDPMAMDFLFVTQRLHGTFINDGSTGEEVVEGSKDSVKPTEKDEKTRKMLSQEFGFDPEFKCFYSTQQPSLCSVEVKPRQ